MSRTSLLRKSSSGYNHGRTASRRRPASPAVRPSPYNSPSERQSRPIPRNSRPASPRVNTPAPRFWKDAARFESADVCDAHVTPPEDTDLRISESDSPHSDIDDHDVHDKENQRNAASLRHLSLRRDEPWILPPPKRVITDEKDIPARILSFDSFRASTRKSNLGGIARGDDYVGFIEIAPTKMQLWRIKSKQFFGKIFGRGGRAAYTVRQHR